MNRRRQRRLILILLFLIGIGSCISLVLYALRQNINLFYYPKDICSNMVPLNKSIYLGGTVARGSISYVGNSRITFQISDNGCKVKVLYIGYLPELFSSGKKAVLKGKLNSQHIFIAKKVLAKHDNKYHPSANNKIYMRE